MVDSRGTKHSSVSGISKLQSEMFRTSVSPSVTIEIIRPLRAFISCTLLTILSYLPLLVAITTTGSSSSIREFQGTFEGYGEIVAPAQIDEVMRVCEDAGYTRDQLIVSENLLDFLRNALQFLYQLASACIGYGTLLLGQREGQQGESRDLGGKSLGRSHSYLRTGMGITSRVGLAGNG